MAKKKNTTNKKSTGKKKQKQLKSNEFDFESPIEPKEETLIKTSVDEPNIKAEEYSSPAFSFEKPIYLQVNRQNLFQYFFFF